MNKKPANMSRHSSSHINNRTKILQINGIEINYPGNEAINTEEERRKFLSIINNTTHFTENVNLIQILPIDIIRNFVSDISDNYICNDEDEEEKIDAFNADNYSSNVSCKS